MEGAADHLNGKVAAVVHVAGRLLKETAIVFGIGAALGHLHAFFFIEPVGQRAEIDGGKIGALE